MTDLSRRSLLGLLSAGVFLAADPVRAMQAMEKAAAATPAAAWDLKDLYPDAAAWETARKAAAAAIPTLAARKGTLGSSAAALREAMQLASDLSLKVGRVYLYAFLSADEDLRVAPNQERRAQSTDLYVALGQASAWMAPETIAVGKPKIDAFLKADPGLAKFRFRLEDTLRQAPHTLSTESEGVIAGAGAVIQGPSEIRDQLASADIPRPTVTLSDGAKATLDDQGYTLHRDAANRADRKLVFDSFWPSYKKFESSLGLSLVAKIKSDIFQSKARKYPNSLQWALSGANLPEGIYRTLVAEVNAGLPQFHRYLEVRRKLLKLPDIRYYDIYPPLVSLDRRFSLDEMRTLTMAAIRPLGPEYGATFAKASSAKWMDPFPRPGKASGAYMAGSAYDVHPYLLLNLSDRYDGLTTYAHEWGHAMHTLLANAAQPYETADYPIFTAEIASTAHEQFLFHHLLAQAKTREEKIFYLGQQLEGIRGTFFRQAMFAEFELKVHDLAEKGEGLSGAKFTEIYLDLLKRYHGPNMPIDPVYGVEWAYIPHFYRDFYVFQYATSITSAVYFAQSVLTGSAAERDRYLGVLKAGGSDYPAVILAKAGLDLSTPAPYRALVAEFSRTLDQVEALI